MVQGQMLGWLDIGIRINDQLKKDLGATRNELNKFSKDLGKSMNFSGAQKQVQGFGNTLIRQFFDIQTIAKQVVHYITFSFGVQMVRMIEGSISQLITSLKDFDKAVTNTTTVSGYIGASFDEAREKIAKLAIEIGKNTIYSATQAAEALYTLAQAGYDVTKVTADDLIPILNYAAATNTTLANAMQDVITVMKQFGLTFEDITTIVDTFTAVVNSTFASAETLRDAFRYTGQIAGALGQNLQQTAAVIGVLADRGYEGGTAGQRLNQIFTQLLRPTEQGQKALASLGVTVSDLNPYTNSLVEILYKLRDANFSAVDASTLFRARTAGAMITLVNEVDAITALNREIQLSAGITESFANKQLKTMWASMEMLKNKTETASLELRSSFVPIINAATDTLSGSVVPAIEGFAQVMKLLVDIIRPFKSILQGLLTILISIGPVILGVAVGAKLLAYALPLIGQSAIVTATGVTSLSAALKMLTFSIFLIVGPIQIISMIFPQMAQQCAILSTAIIALAVAIQFHLLTVIKSSIIAMGSWIAYIGFWKVATIAMTLATNIASIATGIWTGVMLFATIVTGGLTIATYALATALLALPFVAIIAALVWLAQNFGTVVDAITDFVGGITDALGVTQKQNVLTVEQTQKLSELKVAVDAVTLAEQERLAAQQQVNQMMAEGIEDINAYTEAMTKLGNANADFNEKSTKVLQISADLITSIRGVGTDLDKAITSTAEYNSLIREKGTIESSNIKLSKSQTQLLQDYNQAIEEEGINSDKAAQIYEQYITLSDDKVKNDRRLIELSKELGEKSVIMADNTEKLNTEDRERLNIVNQIIEVQEELLTTYDEIVEVQAQISRLQSIDAKLTVLLAERTKDLWEKKLKLLEVEEKLAKLRASEPEVLDEIFNALADHGLLTQEIIDLYVTLKEAQGELEASRIQYFGVLSGLSAEERQMVEDAVKKYHELRDAGISAEDAFEQAFGGLMALIPSLDFSELAVIGDYAEDLWEVADAVDNLGDIFNDLIPVLKNLGLGDVIDAIYEWLKLQPEIETAADDVEEAMRAYNSVFMDTVELISNQWLASGIMETVINKFDKTKEKVFDVTGSFSALAKKIPEVSYAISVFNGNTEEMLSQLLSSTGGIDASKSSMDEYSASTLIATSSIVTMALQQGYALTTTSTLDDMFKFLGLDAATAWKSAVQGANDFTTAGGKPKDTLQVLIDKFGSASEPDTLIGSISAMTTKLDELIKKLGDEPPKNLLNGIQQQTISLIGWIGQAIAGLLDLFAKGSNPPTVKQKVVIDYEPTKNLPPQYTGGTVGGGSGGGTIPTWKWATGGIAGAAKGMFAKGPQLSVIGEAGKEAVIPLEGVNRKYGRELLEYILPKYYPDLVALQAGGIMGGNSRTISYGGDTNENENYNIMGPINIQGVNNVQEFGDTLKWKMRSSSR